MDSNHRTHKRADLQSAAFNHSATSPQEFSIMPKQFFDVNGSAILSAHCCRMDKLEESTSRLAMPGMPGPLPWWGISKII